MCYYLYIVNEKTNISMEAVSYTKARNQLSGLMEQVCQDHDPVIITRQKKPSVVVMSLEVYSVFIIIRTSGPR